jgi:hypothetical protein
MWESRSRKIWILNFIERFRQSSEPKEKIFQLRKKIGPERAA